MYPSQLGVSGGACTEEVPGRVPRTHLPGGLPGTLSQIQGTAGYQETGTAGYQETGTAGYMLPGTGYMPGTCYQAPGTCMVQEANNRVQEANNRVPEA